MLALTISCYSWLLFYSNAI